MDRSKVNQQSCRHLGASHSKEATLKARELTAGGSGTVSTEAIAKKRPRTQIMHAFDFIPALHQDINHNRIYGAVHAAMCALLIDKLCQHAAEILLLGRHAEQNAPFALTSR
jgi:hypothetical protein